MEKALEPTSITKSPNTGYDYKEELAQVNITDGLVARMTERIDTLCVDPITDRRVAAEVDRGRIDVKHIRLAGEKIFEKEIADRYAAHKEAIAQKKTVLGPIIALEERAEARLKEWNDKIAAEQKAKDEQREKEMNDRRNACMDLDFRLRDGVWVLDNAKFDAIDIQKADDEKWYTIFCQMRIVSGEYRDRKEKEAALAEENKKKAEELAAKEKEINSKLNESRRTELSLAGCYFESDHGIRLNIDEFVPFDKLFSIDSERWAAYMAAAQETKVERDKLLQELQAKEEREALVAERVKALKEVGWAMLDNSLVVASNSPIPPEMFDASVMSEERFNALLEEGRAIADRKKKVEQDRIAAEAVEAERQRQEQAAKDKQEREAREAADRMARDGDVEVLRMAEEAIRNVGKLMASLSEKTQHATNKAVMESVVLKLRGCHSAITTAQK